MTEKFFQLLAFTMVCGIIYAIILWSFTYKAPEKSVLEKPWTLRGDEIY